MTVYLIKEDGHGIVGVASSRKAALQYLVRSRWVTENSEMFSYEVMRWFSLKERYGENWKESFLNFSDIELENMDFFLEEYALEMEGE